MQNREKRIWNGKTTITLVVLAFVVAAGLLGLFLFGRMSAESKKFEFGNGNGYIISSVLTEDGVSSTRQYFNANASYRVIRSDEVEFDNTSGESAQVPTDSFIHYADGSIGFLKKVAILDFSKLKDEKDQIITYYSLMPPSALKSTSSGYAADLQGEKQTFESILVRISENRFLVAAPEINVKVGDTTKTIKNGYLEITYFDGDIIRVENQELTYQSIADDMEITVDNTRVDLRNRFIHKNNVAVLDMGLITIDSDDNIALSEYEEEETGEEGEGGDDSDEIGKKERQWNDILDDLANGIIENTTEPDEINEYDRSADPVFTITSMDVTANSFAASVEIEDKDGLLTGDTKIEIVDISSGNAVYQNRLTDGETFFDVSTENLSPETDYAFVVTANYIKDNVEVARTFIQRTFVTESIGVSVDENYVTSYSISAKVKRSSYSKVRELTAILLNPAGETVGGRIVNFEDEGNEAILNFSSGLESNTTYKLLLKDFHYNNMIVTNGFTFSKDFTTLKRKPTLGVPSFTIDKREAIFNINVGDIVDLDNGIVTYRYEVYDARNVTVDQETKQLITGTPVYVIDKSTRGGAEVPVVDNAAIKREVPYVFRLVALFNDNKFEHEYATPVSGVMKMDGKEWPSLIFIEDEVTFEKIDGRILIIDDGGVLDNSKDITVLYKNSIGPDNVYPTNIGSDLEIPFFLEGVRKNESYVVSVYGTIDLKDGNLPKENAYIGSVIIHTKDTNPFQLSHGVNSNAESEAFSLYAALGNGGEGDTDLEANTLSGITFNVYEGDCVDENGQVRSDCNCVGEDGQAIDGCKGKLMRSVTKVDSDGRPYVSELRSRYYDSQFTITPGLFGLRNRDFSSGTYTIEVTGAYDYTVFQNSIGIKDGVFTIEARGAIPDKPEDPNDAIIVTPIRNQSMDESMRSDLDPETIVGYSLQAIYDNSGRLLKKIIYTLHDANGTAIRDYTYDLPAGESNVGTIQILFDGDGISEEDASDPSNENKFHRGDTYYVTYRAALDIDGDGIIDANEYWPSDDTILRSKPFTPLKQKPEFLAYPKSSDQSTFTWAYTFKDVDHAATSALGYDIGITKVGEKELITSDEFQDLVFTGKNNTDLDPGELSAYYNYKLASINQEVVEDTISYKYDGEYSPESFDFTVDVENNRLVLTFEDFETNTLYDRVAAIKLKLQDSSNSNEFKTIENLRFGEDGTIKINLSEIADYVGKTLIPRVYLYYDSGIEGLALSGDRFALEHKLKTGYEYYSLSGNSLVSSVTALGSDFNSSFDLQNRRIALSNDLSIAVELTESGVTYDNSPTIFKKIEETSAASDSFSFDTVVPSVSVKEIVPDLMKASVRAEITGLSNDSIKNNKLYLQMYRSDSTWVDSIRLSDKDVETVLNGNVMQAEITGLEMDTYYYFEVWAEVKTTNGYVMMKLYNFDDPNNSIYRFVTLSKVDIEDITLEYVAEDYDNKYLKLNYSFGSVVTVDGIRYEVYEVNENGENLRKIELGITDDTIIRTDMEKKIQINPGCGVVTNRYYRVYVIPYASETDISSEGSDVFFFDQLLSPFVGVSAKLNQNNKIIFTVTTRDRKKVVKNGKYTIQIMDEDGQDVTPEEYNHGREYDMGVDQAFEFSGYNSDEEYRFRVMFKYDITNESIFKDKTVVYKIKTSDMDSHVGDVSATADINDTSMIRLQFNNSTDITRVKYIQYLVESSSVSGQSWEDQDNFTPNQVIDEHSHAVLFYYYVLPRVRLNNTGMYYIQLQFLDENRDVLATSSLEYLYTRGS